MPELPPNTYIWPLQTAPAAPHVAAGMFCLYCQLKSSGTAVLPVPFEKISVIDDDVEFWLGLASLACTVVIIPTMYPTTQIVLLPVIFLVVKLASRILAQGGFQRLVFVALLCLLGWPWIAAGVLSILHLASAVEHLRNAWLLSLGPVPVIPPPSLFILFPTATDHPGMRLFREEVTVNLLIF